MQREINSEGLALLYQPELDKPGDACGLVGYYSPVNDEPGSPFRERVDKALTGMHAVQHRGQSGAGMAVFDSEGFLFIVKGDGLVAEVMGEKEQLALHFAADRPAVIIHDRYSTSGKDRQEGDNCLAQPFEAPSRKFALGHNGHVEFIGRTADKLGYDVSDAESDSQAITYLLDQVCEERGCDLISALHIVMPHIDGAATLVMNEPDRLIGARDLTGYRPLVIGTTGPNEYVFASETIALDMMKAEFVRDVGPGEIVWADEDGLHSEKIDGEVDERNCLFETIYVTHRNSMINGSNVASTRKELGRKSGELHPVEADVVIPVLDSGDDYATGYSEATGIPKKKDITKNPYIPRTFIQKNQLTREKSVSLKHQPNKVEIQGKRVVLADDSLIRGTTMKTLISMVREAGAAEVHVRIPSPPYTNSCFYGMDTRDTDELVSHNMTVEEVCKYIGADSLEFLDLEDVLEVVNAQQKPEATNKIGKFCTACMNGDYKSGVPVELIGKPSS